MTNQVRRNRQRFVADGCGRARTAAEPEIRAGVVAAFSDQLETATFWRWIWLQIRISREVKLRLNKAAPPGAFY